MNKPFVLLCSSRSAKRWRNGGAERCGGRGAAAGLGDCGAGVEQRAAEVQRGAAGGLARYARTSPLQATISSRREGAISRRQGSDRRWKHSPHAMFWHNLGYSECSAPAETRTQGVKAFMQIGIALCLLHFRIRMNASTPHARASSYHQCFMLGEKDHCISNAIHALMFHPAVPSPILEHGTAHVARFE